MMTIVIFGPPLSGKTTLLRAFAEQKGSVVAHREGGDHDTAPVIYFVRLAIGDSDIELATIPGSPWNTSDWNPLLSAANGLVATFDLQRAREIEMKSARDQIDPYLQGRPYAAILTKVDLCPGEPTAKCMGIDEAIDRYRLHDWRIFASGKSEPATEALQFIVDASYGMPPASSRSV
ncbi:MAG: GTPase domain-containing protein [Acidobacteriota bacterium]|nr:GTPase domain-containing protein [Acidobacteriota bacterium]